MKISLLCIGKSKDKGILDSIQKYVKRLDHYTNFELIELKDPKPHPDPKEQLAREADIFKSRLGPDDYIILLDEKGISYSSRQFAEEINRLQVKASKRLVFVIGGAYGHHESIRKMSHTLMTLSPLTFPHDLVRLIFVEQLYRAFTILRNEKYHND